MEPRHDKLAPVKFIVTSKCRKTLAKGAETGKEDQNRTIKITLAAAGMSA
jgi:hypothetical protein